MLVGGTVLFLGALGLLYATKKRIRVNEEGEKIIRTLFISKNNKNEMQVLLRLDDNNVLDAIKKEAFVNLRKTCLDCALYEILSIFYNVESAKEKYLVLSRDIERYLITTKKPDFLPILETKIDELNIIRVFMFKDNHEKLCYTTLDNTQAYTYGSNTAGWVKWENIQKIKDCNDTKPLTGDMYSESNKIDPVILNYLKSDKDFAKLMEKN